MSVGTKLFQVTDIRCRMRFFKLFTQEIMSRHPTQGHEKQLPAATGTRSVMKLHRRSGEENCCERSGGVGKVTQTRFPLRRTSFLEGGGKNI